MLICAIADSSVDLSLPIRNRRQQENQISVLAPILKISTASPPRLIQHVCNEQRRLLYRSYADADSLRQRGESTRTKRHLNCSTASFASPSAKLHTSGSSTTPSNLAERRILVVIDDSDVSTRCLELIGKMCCPNPTRIQIAVADSVTMTRKSQHHSCTRRLPEAHRP